jgi:hypothetical protein
LSVLVGRHGAMKPLGRVRGRASMMRELNRRRWPRLEGPRRRARYAAGGGGGFGGLGCSMTTRKVLAVLMSAFLGLRFKGKPRLPEWTGLELDSMRPLQSPVSPSAPTRNVAFGSAPCLICALGYYRSAREVRISTCMHKKIRAISAHTHCNSGRMIKASCA